MKKHWFKLVLASLVLVCGVVIWGLLATLWGSMAEYEASSEIGAVTEYFDRFAAGDYNTAADSSGFVFDEKNSKEDYIQYLKDAFGSDFSDLRFAGREGETEGEKTYCIYAGNDPLGLVRLIPVSDGGRRWKVIAEVEYAPSVSILAPAYVTVSANGVQLSPDEGAEPVLDEDFKALSGFFEVPAKVAYTLDGYLYEPSVTAVAPDGTPCDLTEAEDGNIVVTVPPTEAQREEFETLMTDFSRLYACFVAKDTSFAQLKPKMIKNTPFYKAVAGFYNGWYISHTGYEFRDMRISDIVRPAEGYFAGTICFDHVILRNKKENVYSTSYRLSFREVDGVWLLADLKIL